MTDEQLNERFAEYRRQGLSADEIIEIVANDPEMSKAAMLITIRDYIDGKFDPAAEGNFRLAATLDEAMLHIINKGDDND